LTSKKEFLNMMKKNWESKPKRSYKHTISFNEKEIRVIGQFVNKYGIKNKSKFFREAIIATILQKAEEDYPTLF
jgi:metal-responsive CopG/Arc/MetJ family transcriptional regulator